MIISRYIELLSMYEERYNVYQSQHSKYNLCSACAVLLVRSPIEHPLYLT
jgi:RNase P subunit RPR2